MVLLLLLLLLVAVGDEAKGTPASCATAVMLPTLETAREAVKVPTGAEAGADTVEVTAVEAPARQDRSEGMTNE